MNDKEARKAVSDMMAKIIMLCQEYAIKDGLPLKPVLRMVGKALSEIGE